MELRIQNGDYVPDGLGGAVRCQGADALLERVLFRLTARRGGLPLLPRLPSRGRRGKPPLRAVSRNRTRSSRASVPWQRTTPPSPSGT